MNWRLLFKRIRNIIVVLLIIAGLYLFEFKTSLFFKVQFAPTNTEVQAGHVGYWNSGEIDQVAAPVLPNPGP